jgi:hypothetical protein
MRNFRIFKAVPIAVIFTGLVIPPANAQQLKVISDNGHGIPLGQYNNVLITGVNRDEAKFTKFPIQSELKPGVLGKPVQVMAHRSAKWLANPLALIGSDARSQGWLKANAEALARVGADVFVVDVPDAKTFKAVVQTGQGLRNMTPTHSPRLEAQLIAARAGVIPLFIDTNGLASQSVLIGDERQKRRLDEFQRQ